MKKPSDNEKRGLDESLRRMGSILASPWLATAYTRTEPRLERAWLRRAGLTKPEAERFLDMLCRRGALDGGAKAAVEKLCRARSIAPAEALRLLLAGEGWEEAAGQTEEEDNDAEI